MLDDRCHEALEGLTAVAPSLMQDLPVDPMESVDALLRAGIGALHLVERVQHPDGDQAVRDRSQELQRA